jgi:phosphoglycolate phosphatase
MLEQNLKYYGLINYFTIISGLNDRYANGKIENGLKLIKESLISPSETILIGDTLHDFEVAKEMGIDCIFISSGHQSMKRLKAIGIPIYNSLIDIEI